MERATPDRSGYRVCVARLGQEPDDDIRDELVRNKKAVGRPRDGADVAELQQEDG